MSNSPAAWKFAGGHRRFKSSWLPEHLARSAQSILGLDILESEVGELRRRGYDVVSGDATTAPSRWGISLGGMAWR
jgi:hypothetical protein